jgi:hypothetical protein
VSAADQRVHERHHRARHAKNNTLKVRYSRSGVVYRARRPSMNLFRELPRPREEELDRAADLSVEVQKLMRGLVDEVVYAEVQAVTAFWPQAWQ